MSQSAVRSALFVPGSRPERFAKAVASGADRVIVDFEDAVEESLKRQARENLHRYLQAHVDVSVVVRVNAADHPEHAADLAFCAQVVGVTTILLPKAETLSQVECAASTGKCIWPLIESARGLHNLAAIAAGKQVERLTFGALDLGLELGVRAGSAAAQRLFDQVRYQLLLHTALSGLARPLDTVFADINDIEGLRCFARDALHMGFGGMLCIHPGQVGVVGEVFQPTEQERLWARRVVDAAQGAAGAFRLDGQMVDAPVIAQARRLLGED